MKVIKHPENIHLTVQKAAQNDRLAQKRLFETYAPEMLKVCRRFIKDLQFAEDSMIKGFTKAFKALNTFDYTRSFDAWLRQIMINEAISFLRSKHARFITHDTDVEKTHFINPDRPIDDVQQAIDRLPEGFKTVFLLNVVEGYKHREIADKLSISVGTSKSQLSRARKLLRQYLQEFNTPNYERQKL